MSTRGEHLVRADRGFATGGGLVARVTAPAFSKVLDQIDRRLARGGIDATLPGGEKRQLGFHAKGPKAVVRLSSWLALVRLATSGSVGWYKAWTLGEWSSPDPVALFILALFLGYVYQRTHRIIAPVFVHACVNALSMIQLWLLVFGEP